MSHPFSAAIVALKFMEQVYRLHSLPEAIISDRDPIFTSKFWQELFRLTKTELNLSTASHPETDGQTERVNQCLEIFLRCFVHACPRKWSRWLSLAELWYNTSHHSAIDRSPFKPLYGHEPRYFGIEAYATLASSLRMLAPWMIYLFGFKSVKG